jgi:hypothetical protein
MKQHTPYWFRSLVFGLALVLVAVLVAVAGGQPAAGSSGKQPVSSHIEQITPAIFESELPDGVISEPYGQYSALTGAPLALYQVNYPVRPGTPEAMARQYLADNAAALHLRQPDLSDLAEHFTRTGPAGTTVRFHQSYSGVPVYKGEVVVHLNNDGMVSFYSSTYRPDLDLADPAPDLSPAEARALVHGYLAVEGPLQHDSTRLVVVQLNGRTHLAYEVQVLPAAPLGDWEGLVDAHSGALLRLANTAAYLEDAQDLAGLPRPARSGDQAPTLVDGDGNVFDPDPLTSATATYGDPGYVDGNDANTPELIAQQFNRPMLDIEFAGGLYTLRGPFAAIVDTEGPFNGLFSQASSSWAFNRFDDAFEAANTYYHIDTAMRYINLTLGVPVMPYQYSGGARFDPHGLNGADNSHYTGSTGVVAFGEGGVDDAEDADVIWHELGHGLHHWITGGSLSQVNGLSEGIGDYWAESYSRSLGYWQMSDPQYFWVFGWDGHNPFWNGRVTNWPNLYPGGLTGQIHTDGQIWSSVNLEIYELIGREKIDTAHWEGIATTNSSTNQEQAANAVLQAAIDLGYSVPDLLDIRGRYIARGYVMAPLPPATFALNAAPAGQAICAGDPASYTIDVLSIVGFSGVVTLDASGHPAGTTTNFNPNSQAAPYTSTLTIGNTGGAAAGSYTIQISGQDITGTIRTADVDLDVNTIPAAINLTAPADGSSNVALTPTFSWSADSQAATYTLEVAADAGFSNIVISESGLSGTSYTAAAPLDPDTTYYWRVRGENNCGIGSYSAVFSFTTIGENLVYLPLVLLD